MSEWPDIAVDYVQAITDTKIVLGHRYAQWSLTGPSLEDDIGGASAAQEEVGHVRQLFRLLEDQGRDSDWLDGHRDPEAVNNVASLDSIDGEWPEYLTTMATADRAAWYLLDAIDHEDFGGMVTKMGEDEYFHLEYHDARLESLAEKETDAIQSTLEETLPHTLAFIGPAEYDAESDPLYEAGFTDRPVSEIRESYLGHFEDLFEGTPVSLENVDRSVPDIEAWNETRRRVNGGSIPEADLVQIRGDSNELYVMD
ncbi:ring-1,2-phenylacetyl-CoA epoxidase subunit PaaC [Halopenitus malekzadehii]|uniref:Ring-1,2-phenylacetyl-CoA epoxidase subunit PaaC n=1 Tax=Halopenitus malekzadehii TaxID=1267564 RepID=A0A1H6IQR5_9EURY|nr:Phenylacetic acid catabolic protein [Halopenitus malekzadehii]SEH51498.1 ring-1,2-phenylacetyl-CoA epoxidase subunit PaaC [Halopenitus malekzadehii]